MKSKSKQGINKTKIAIIFLILLLFGGLIFLGLSYKNSQDEVKRLSNPAQAAKQENKELVITVSKLVELPSKEEPTIATVKDVSKLQNQSFFKNAKNGDKVLIFTQAKKAILYRPSTNKVIEVAPINLGNQPKTDSAPTPAATDTNQNTTSTSTPANESNSNTDTAQ